MNSGEPPASNLGEPVKVKPRLVPEEKGSSDPAAPVVTPELLAAVLKQLAAVQAAATPPPPEPPLPPLDHEPDIPRRPKRTFQPLNVQPPRETTGQPPFPEPEPPRSFRPRRHRNRALESLKKRPDRGPSWDGRLHILWAAVIAVLACTGVGVLSFSVGIDNGVARAEAAALKENVSLSPEVREAIEQGMKDLLDGRGEAAAAQFQAVKTTQPALSSLSILTARAALQAGDLNLAQRMVDEALAARESISEALTIQALIEARLATTESFKSMGNPRVRIEQLLQRAIAADVTDPRPFIELAVLRRFERKFDEAQALLQAAQARQSASTDRLALDVSVELLTLQQLDDDALRNRDEKSFDGLPAPLLRAYRALRLGDSATAEASLAEAFAKLPAPTFKQCLRDPAFVSFGKSPLLQSYLMPPQSISHD